MELFNSLSGDREQDIADFLTFIPIYNSKRRIRAYYSLLRKFKASIQGQVCCEAGAGRGLISQKMAEMGAEKVYAVERSGVLFDLLEEGIQEFPQIESVEEDIEFWEPEMPIQTLVHEFYGPLVLDETMLVLQKMNFSPTTILPDGGRLWAMPIMESTLLEKEQLYEPAWKNTLAGALISDLFEHIPFEPTWEVFHWDVHQNQETFRFEVPEACDFIALCGEITHEQQPVLKMWWTNNWPVIYTPVSGKVFEIAFDYAYGYTQVKFEWVE